MALLWEWRDEMPAAYGADRNGCRHDNTPVNRKLRIARGNVMTDLPLDVARTFGRTELAKDLEKKLNP
jgi:hypothetical protein